MFHVKHFALCLFPPYADLIRKMPISPPALGIPQGFTFQGTRRPRVSLVFARLTCAAIFRLRLLCSSFDGAILSDARIKANCVLRFYVAFMSVFRLYRRFYLAKIAKTRKTRNFSRFREKVAQKTNGLFVRFDGRTVPRRAYTLYI